MGKSCIRFRRVEDLALDVIGEAIRRVPAQKFIAYYEANIRTMSKSATKKAKRATATKKVAPKKPGTRKVATKATSRKASLRK
jgi:hypothetical protein